MKPVKSQPCLMGDNDAERNSPANAEMALAYAIHDHADKLLKFSRPALNSTNTAFQEWLTTIENSIAFYRLNK
jgi:hypothetical protein